MAKFKAIEKNAVNAPVKDIQWEGEEVAVESKTKIEEDKGTGRAVVLRFFDFGANPQAFKIHKPTAQELFNTHLKGIEAVLWKDGLKVLPEVQPRLMFSKDKTKYRFIIPSVPVSYSSKFENTQTLSQILHDTRRNTV